MADNYLITGYWGKAHITAENDRGINAASFGKGRFVLPVGAEFHAEYIGNNTIRMYDGKLLDNGAAAGIPAGEYVDLLIANAGQGKKRNDLIVFQYEQDGSTLIESGKFVVIQGAETSGTASDPALTQQDLLSNEATFDQFALWRVPVSGTAISAPVKLFEVSKSLEEITPTLFEFDYNQSSGAVTFRNGKTAAQLFQCLENNKPVEVKCYSSISCVTLKDIGKSSLGNATVYQFSSFSNQGGIVATLNSSSLSVVLMIVGDSVVEQNTDGIWTYRKWASGIAECWCQITLGELTANSHDPVMGWYLSDSQQQIPLPSGLFAKPPLLFGDIQPPTGKCLFVRFHIMESKNNVYFRILGGVNDFPNAGAIVSLQVKGTWQ